MFFSLNFLAATQDIAVDGWALTMLQKRNVSYGSTCNCVGVTAGYFLAYVILLAFSSADFCNNYIRMSPQSYGIITLGGENYKNFNFILKIVQKNLKFNFIIVFFYLLFSIFVIKIVIIIFIIIIIIIFLLINKTSV